MHGNHGVDHGPIRQTCASRNQFSAHSTTNVAKTISVKTKVPRMLGVWRIGVAALILA